MRTKKLARTLFGKYDRWDDPKNVRGCSMRFPSVEDGEPDRVMRYRSDDGIVLALIKRMERLEEQSRKIIKKP